VVDRELALESIRGQNRWKAHDVSRLLVAPNRPDSMHSHDSGHPLASDAFARFTKIQEDSRTPIDAATRGVSLSNEDKQPLVLDRSVRQRLVDPRIEAARSDFQDPTHRPNREPIAMGMDERVLYSGSLAKYAAAFFQDVSLFLSAAELGPKLQVLLLRVEELVRTVFILARTDGAHPLLQAMARDPQTVGDFLHGMTLLGHLANGFALEFGRESLLTHETPLIASILASEVSAIPGELHNAPAAGRAAEILNDVLRAAPTGSFV
jgi:hypothetical protein